MRGGPRFPFWKTLLTDVGVCVRQDWLMKTEVQTPMEVFHLPQHLEVPLFQRSYVWGEEEQWAPLWQDIRRLADIRLRDPYGPATHFLGAVVLQAHEIQHGHLSTANVIDGQQRLTTLQIVMSAAELVLDEAGLESLAGQLEALTCNQSNFVQPGDSNLKLRHTNRDREAFDEVMGAEPPVQHASLKHSASLIVRAHEFFTRSIAAWLGDTDAQDFPGRADALVSVLARGLQLVVISLNANENSQEIFETLNARGTPLTAADLIKNFVFQRLASEGVDTKHAYANDWPFDTKFWEVEVSVGRYLVSRSSLFLNQWLMARTGEEIGPQSTFTRFKTFIEHECGKSMKDLLPEIKQQASQYQEWTEAAEDPNRQLTPVEMAVYRMRANTTELLKPILIWLHAPERHLPQDIVDEVIRITESWIVRRQLLRLTGSDLGRIVADLIRIYRETPPADLPEQIRSHLARLNVSSTYWPGDDEIREALTTESVYRRFKRGRLRMLLESIEDSYRASTNQPQVPRRGYPIEHVLPQKWDSNWPVEGLEAEQERASRVHRLGNLTLLTSSLNSKVSNGPWLTKRAAFSEHDTLLLTSRLLRASETTGWDETTIDERTNVLVGELLRIWPVPAGHSGVVLDSQSKEPDWVEVKHLVIAGSIEPGTRLTPRSGRWESARATIRPDGLIEVNGVTFETPSGAAKHVRGGATNGWYFWRLEDGRTLKDVRDSYRGTQPVVGDRFDWKPLHQLLESLPEGRWVSYGTLASVIGTAAQPVGSHIGSCLQCTNVHRVLRTDGAVAENFAWSDPDDNRLPADLLAADGIRVISGKADPAMEIVADELFDSSAR